MENKKNNIVNYDKRHSDYRAALFINILNLIRQKYINSIRFTGDDNFTLAKQRTMLKMAFDRGFSGLHNHKKTFSNELSMFDNENVDIALETMGLETHIPLSISGQIWDTSERIVEGYGVTSPRHNLGRKSFKTTRNDTAFFIYNSDFSSGYMRYLQIAYTMATGETILKKRLTLIDTKLAANSNNNQVDNKQFDTLYDVESSFINLNSSQSSITGADKASQIRIGDMLMDKIAKLTMADGETINNLQEFIKEYKTNWNHLMGVRTNTNKVTDRSITDDFKSEETHFKTMEQEVKDQCELFCDDYKRVYGIKLEYTFKPDEVLEEIMEHEKSISGRENNANGGNDGTDKTT